MCFASIDKIGLFFKSAHNLSELQVNVDRNFPQAPEMMYASLDLPGMVQEATKDLPDHLVKDCFSNILVTGKRNLHSIIMPFKIDSR